MKFEENLTNEVLTKRFANQFELVRYAIARARNAILAGRDPQVRSETQNLSAKVLVEIGLGIDQFDDLEEDEEDEVDYVEKTAPAKVEIIDFDADDEDEDEDEDLEEANPGKGKKS